MFPFEMKATNLDLPVPWPWLVPFGSLPFVGALRTALVGCFFLLVLVFAVIAPVTVIARKCRGLAVSPLLVATAALSVPYAHFAFSRADVGHLALGIFPALFGLFAVLLPLDKLSRCFAAAVVCGVSLFVSVPQHPFWQCHVTEWACPSSRHQLLS